MDYLLAILRGFITDETQIRTVFVGLITVSFFGIAIALSLLINSASSPLRRRLKMGRPQSSAKVAGDRLAKTVEPISDYILPAMEIERNRVLGQLVHAGYRTKNALTVFYATKALLAICFPLLVLLVAPFSGLETKTIIFAVMLASAIGVFGPNIFLRRKVTKRQRAVRHGFPDALDLLVVCVEAGLGLSTAIQRVAEEVSVAHPELADDLMIVTSEIRAGIDSVEALKNLAARTGLKDIRGLVTLLAQSMRFGTSIADTLRVYSEEFRDKRMQAAEEQAAKLGTKLIFPLVTCLFPAFFVVTIGPAILKVLAAVGRI